MSPGAGRVANRQQRRRRTGPRKSVRPTSRCLRPAYAGVVTYAEVAVTSVPQRVGWALADVERELVARVARERPIDDLSVVLGGSARGSALRK